MNIRTLLANLAIGHYLSYLIYDDESYLKEALECMKMASEAVVIQFNAISLDQEPN